MTEGLGERIRAARLARGTSLRATASGASISPSLLSQVETGKVQPSVSTLYAIVNALGLSMDDVLGRPDAHSPRGRSRIDPVQRRETAPEIVMENGVTWRGLAIMQGSEDLDAVHVTYAPGGSSSVDDTHMRHGGIEHGYIIRGELVLKLDFESYVLRPGDSVSFNSMRPHLYVNQSGEPAEGIWFVLGLNRAPARGGAEFRTAVDVLDELGRLQGRAETDEETL